MATFSAIWPPVLRRHLLKMMYIAASVMRKLKACLKFIKILIFYLVIYFLCQINANILLVFTKTQVMPKLLQTVNDDVFQ